MDLKILLGQNDKTYFARDFTEPAERALAWVLWALFAYILDIGLELKEEYPAFWYLSTFNVLMSTFSVCATAPNTWPLNAQLPPSCLVHFRQSKIRLSSSAPARLST